MMATSSTSSFQSNKKSKENIRATSEVSDTSSLNTGRNIVRDSGEDMVRRDMPLSDPESSKADSSDTMNSGEDDVSCDSMVFKHLEALGSSHMSLTNESHGGNFSDPRKNLLSCDEEEKTPEEKDGVEGNSAFNVRFENTYETQDVQDETDGSLITKLAVWEDWNDDMQQTKVQLYHLNQQNKKGRFLKMELDGDSEMKISATGEQYDPYTYWLTHYALDEERNQVLILQNEECSEHINKKCVLYTQKVAGSVDYVLTGKKLDVIPGKLDSIYPNICFIKRPRTGSELLVLRSMLATKERSLLVGFDKDGQPIPLNKVKKYSHDFQAFFKILAAG